MTDRSLTDNADLREEAANAIANYMHHELFEITGDTKMLPWLREQGDQFMQMIDRSIAKAKSLPIAAEIKRMRGDLP
jgi:hypothetical protein